VWDVQAEQIAQELGVLVAAGSAGQLPAEEMTHFGGEDLLDGRGLGRAGSRRSIGVVV
jgi:hypothetical protein